MIEKVFQYSSPVGDESGRMYAPRIHGEAGPDGHWRAWIAFQPMDGGEIIVTDRETTQPNAKDLEYWVTGLSVSYMEGALNRAKLRRPDADGASHDRSSAEDGSAAKGADGAVPPPRAVLDPFKVYRQGEQILRDELSALSTDHLRSIILAHSLAPTEVGLAGRTHGQLTELIVLRVKEHG